MNVPLTNCIYCNATENLNTQLGITLEDGSKAQVFICDLHAEDASVKTAKAAFLERQKQIEAFMAQAKALGLQLAPTNTATGLVLTSSKPVQLDQAAAHPPAPPASGPAAAPILDEEEGMIETDKIDRAGRRGMVSVGGAVPAFGAVSAYASHAIEDVRQQLGLDVLKGKVKLEQIEDRAGRPIAIPAKRVDGTGVTHIRVVNTGGDQALQKRFKDMALATIHDQHPGFADKYDLRPCPVCQGLSMVRDRGQEVSCPKCGGQGVL